MYFLMQSVFPAFSPSAMDRRQVDRRGPGPEISLSGLPRIGTITNHPPVHPFAPIHIHVLFILFIAALSHLRI